MYPHIYEVMQATRFYRKITLADSTKQVSQFSSTLIKGHFSWYSLLNVWIHLFFTGNSLAIAHSVDLAMLSLSHETFCKWLADSNQLAASRMQRSLQETL